MKKFMIACLALLLMMSMSLTALAVEGGFVDSPSLNPAPRMISFRADSAECEAELDITAYVDRANLSEEDRTAIEAAYTEIKGSDDLSVLNADLAALAESLDVAGTDLAVSDLFDMDYVNCTHENHKDLHGNFQIQLEAETLDNFVGLLHRNNGTWELVEAASVDGNVMTFSIDGFSPFAIVVNTGKHAPDTGDNSMVYMWGIVAAVSALAVVICLREAKKYASK